MGLMGLVGVMGNAISPLCLEQGTPKTKAIFGKKFKSDPNSAETTKTTIHFEGLGWRVSQISKLD